MGHLTIDKVEKMKKLILIFIAVFSLNLFSEEYNVDKSKENLVKFISEATMESFEGVTNKIDGYLLKKTDDLKGAEIYFEVDLSSVDTGIGLRNRHMREDYLHTDKYQFTKFDGKITEVNPKGGNLYEVKAKGKMFIHGVTKDKTVSATINIANNTMRIETDFTVKLTDYKIKIPEFMFLKINEEIALELEFFLRKV